MRRAIIMRKLIIILPLLFVLGSCDEHCDSRGGCDHAAIHRDLWQPVTDFTNAWTSNLARSIRCQWNLSEANC